MNWAHAGTAVVAAFLASLVEFVEALTIVLAVGTTRGWRSALTGAAAGALALALLTLAFGPALQRIPISDLQLVVGVLLLLFGMRWLRKAMLRAAGVIGFHDEAAIYARETAALETTEAQTARDAARFDRVAVATSFKAVMLEGLEVIFIVIATGAGGQLVPAALGAALAGLLVILAGVALRRPLARVPENTLKYAVGVLLSAFGVFWIGEGLHYPWPGEDLALVALAGGFLLVSLIGVALARSSLVGRAATVAEGHP
jgi:Ca2+/H+ antiporter, TMEM165/GDT1 family